MAPTRDQVAEPYVLQCKGCRKFLESRVTCPWYLYPAAKWRAGNKCPGATHLKQAPETPKEKKLGQQKQVKKTEVSKKQAKFYSRMGGS